METINAYLFSAMQKHADKPMQVLKDRTWTYGEAAAAMNGVVGLLKSHGVGKGDRVALIAENSPRWFHVYAGALAVGAVVVPRGEDISDNELNYIIEHSESKHVFAGTTRSAERVAEGLDVIDMTSDEFPDPVPVTDEVLEEWKNAVGEEDLAVLLYTSGTTGNPKGVMLEHRNIAHNIRVVPQIVDIRPEQVWVSVLPSWHTFELTVELCAFSCGSTTVYSSKRHLKEDLKKYAPHYFASVPRIWETIYDGIQKAVEKKGGAIPHLLRFALNGSSMVRRGNPLGYPGHMLGKALFYKKVHAALGGRMLFSVSGGGYLPPAIDEFFANAGLKLLIGYGLTETSPVIALRDPVENTLGTIGRAVPETEFKIGPDGTFLVRGPQVMRGYYKEPDLTKAVLSDDGWLDTGDLGRITDKGDLVFIGRRKETIVLSGGENVEPEPLEQSILQSPLIQQVMLVGQDKKTLGALIVADPEKKPSREQVAAELKQRTGPSGGFRSFENVLRFQMLDEPFSPENGFLTATLKMRRNVIAEQLQDRIEDLYT
ncbi:MAG: AMP-dependent synthetase/ligase [Planctomycetota bacterium]|jgi:long-chain acyl-CoA synthetase